MPLHKLKEIENNLHIDKYSNTSIRWLPSLNNHPIFKKPDFTNWEEDVEEGALIFSNKEEISY